MVLAATLFEEHASCQHIANEIAQVEICTVYSVLALWAPGAAAGTKA